MASIGEGDLLAMLPAACFERPLVRLGGGRRPIVVVSDPAVIRTVLVEEADAFPKSSLMIGAFEPLLGNGLLISNGEAWRRHRSMLDGAFARLRARTVFAHMRTALEAFAARAEAAGAVVSLGAEMSALTLDVIYRAILSTGPQESEARAVREAFSAYQRLVPQVKPLHLVGRFRQEETHRAELHAASEVLRGLIGNLVERRMQAPRKVGLDALQAVIEARDEKGRPLTHDEVIDQVAVLFLAGHETSANALTWALFLLSQYPVHADAVRAEADRVAAGRELDLGHVGALVLARQVFLEALRLYPPAAFLTRTAARSTLLGGVTVPEGALVIISPWIVHRHKLLWTNPDSFVPDRFARERESLIQGGTYIPFGWGPRICTGRALALTEIPYLLAEIVRRFDLTVEEADKVRPVARLTIVPADPIHCTFRRRAE